MDNELITSQNGGEKPNNRDGDGGSIGKRDPNTVQQRRGKLGGRQGTEQPWPIREQKGGSQGLGSSAGREEPGKGDGKKLEGSTMEIFIFSSRSLA